MDFVGYMRVFRERWLAIVACVVLGLLAAVAITVTTHPVYQASATLFLKVDSDSSSLYDRSQFSVQRVKSYPDLVDSPSVLQPVIDQLGLDTTPQALAANVSASNPIDTVALKVTAQADEAKLAAQIANSVSAELAKEVSTLETAKLAQSATGKNPIPVSSIELVLTVPAQTPTAAASPNKTVNLAIGLLSGLAGGLILALLLSLFDRRLRTAAGIRKAGGLPLISLVPRGHRGWARLLGRNHAAAAAIAHGEILTNLQLIGDGRLPRVLALAPATTPATVRDLRLQLARAASELGRAAAIIETDAATAGTLPEEARAAELGLTNVLADSATIDDAIIVPVDDTIAILPAGPVDAAPTREVVAREIGSVLEAMGDLFEFTVVQASPHSRPVDLASVAAEVDSVVIVVQFARTQPDDLSRLVTFLEANRVRPLGVIMTSVPRWRRSVVVDTWLPGDIVDAHGPTRLHTVDRSTSGTGPAEGPGTGADRKPLAKARP